MSSRTVSSNYRRFPTVPAGPDHRNSRPCRCRWFRAYSYAHFPSRPSDLSVTAQSGPSSSLSPPGLSLPSSPCSSQRSLMSRQIPSLFVIFPPARRLGTENHHVQYSALFLAVSGVNSAMPVIVYWFNSNYKFTPPATSVMRIDGTGWQSYLVPPQRFRHHSHLPIPSQ